MLKGVEEDLKTVDSILSGKIGNLPSITWTIEVGGRLSRGKVICVLTVTIWVGHHFPKKITWTPDDLEGLGEECHRVALEVLEKIQEIAHQSDKR